MSQETENEEEVETLNLRDQEEADSIKLEIQHLQNLVSFGQTESGRILIEERERAVIKHINKLFTYLNTPDLQGMTSHIAQLKVAIRDLTDFKGSQSALETRETLLATILKKKS